MGGRDQLYLRICDEGFQGEIFTRKELRLFRYVVLRGWRKQDMLTIAMVGNV
jgi:hypothetical protein